MKKIFFIALALLGGFQCASAQTVFTVKVDERVEFATVVCNITGVSDTRTPKYQSYADDVAEYFSPYVSLISHLMFNGRLEGYLDYEKLIDFALSSTISDGKIAFSLTQINSDIEDNAERVYYKELFSTLEYFYAKSSFNNFFKSNKELYKEAEELYNKKVVSNLNLNVLDDILGSSNDATIYITLLGGIRERSYIRKGNSVVIGGFSGPVSNGTSELRLGRYNPIYDTFTLATALSSIALYTDIEKQSARCEKQTVHYYKSAFYLFDKMGYEVNDIYYAQITQLVALLYAERVDGEMVPILMYNNKCSGFIWENELWESLVNFKDNRSKYPYFKDYLPTLTMRYRELLRY